MVEDTPHDLVHDFAAEAVFGTHPLGRPVIGRADVISSVSRRALAAYHRRAYSAEQIVLAAAGNLRHERLVELLEERRNGVSAGGGLPTRKSMQADAASRPPLPVEGDRAVPRLPERTGHRSWTSAASPPPSSTRSSVAQPPRGSSRRSARSGGWPTPSTPTRRSTPMPARSVFTWAPVRRTCPRASRSPWPSSPTWQPATFVATSSRAREGEPQGKASPVARVHLEPDDASREGDDHGHAAP